MGKVPSYSMGFCVASTRNGAGSGRVMPSAVTCRSCMASSSAAWVRGVARLISSASRMLTNTGPGRNSKPLVCWLNTLTPVMSLGSRSGVHCSRLKLMPMLAAVARASIVLPVPGTSSMSTCPWHSMAAISSSICGRLPTMTVSTLWMI